MSPPQHGVKLPSVLHAALERREEDLRGVGEDDDAHRDQEVLGVHGQRQRGPGPAVGSTQTVQHDQKAEKIRGYNWNQTNRLNVKIIT